MNLLPFHYKKYSLEIYLEAQSMGFDLCIFVSFS